MPADIQSHFGTAVRARRKHLGISQEELAERAGLHRTYVADVERGARNLSLGSIEKLAYALEISIPILFTHAGGVVNRRSRGGHSSGGRRPGGGCANTEGVQEGQFEQSSPCGAGRGGSSRVRLLYRAVCGPQPGGRIHALNGPRTTPFRLGSTTPARDATFSLWHLTNSSNSALCCGRMVPA